MRLLCWLQLEHSSLSKIGESQKHFLITLCSPRPCSFVVQRRTFGLRRKYKTPLKHSFFSLSDFFFCFEEEHPAKNQITTKCNIIGPEHFSSVLFLAISCDCVV